MMNSDNVFASAARTAASMTVTENGHTAASTTGSALLDLYAQVGALRGQDEKRICQLLDLAVAEDRLLATKIIFYARDCRGGTGEREVFRTMLRRMTKIKPAAVVNNLELIPEFGRWDDLYAIADPEEFEDVSVHVWDLIQNQLLRDEMNSLNGKPISLLGKWLKSCNASSKETRRLGRMTCEQLGYSEKEYRKILKMLRDRIRIVESQMSAQEWDKIDYEAVPSRAGMIYRGAFRKHDEERYKAYISSVKRGEKKINASMNTPQDLVHAYGGGGPEDPTIEVMWKNLPDYVKSDENVLCMVDTSGSMSGRPMEISVGLGMYFAQRNTGAFHNLFMTFESEPRFFELRESLSFHDNLERAYNAPWGGSTDLNRACKSMLELAVAKRVPQRDMPTRLVIISDMEIDSAAGIYRRSWWNDKTTASAFSDILHVDELREMYEQAGYRMPQVIYWNVESRDNHFQTRSDVPGTMLASGSSPRVFEAVMAMQDYQATPYDAMLEVLNGERYKEVK